MSTTASLQFEFVIDDPAVPSDTFQVASFKGFEQVNKTFEFTVDLVSFDSDISLSELAFKPATLEVYRDDQQLIFHGLVAHFEQGPHVGDRYGYRVTFVPPMWFLSLYFNSRIFMERTVPEIIESVLQEVGFSSQHYELRLNASYPVREYLAQHQETDLNFISRLCEREGIRFSFHADDGKIIFSDEITSESNLIEQVLTYNPGGGMEASAEAVRTLTSREKVISDEMYLRDYNYRTASATNEVLEATEGYVQLAEGSPWQGGWMQHYEYGLHHQDQGNTDRLTKVRLEEKVCQSQAVSGSSGYVGLRVGYIMTVEGHFRDDLNGDFFLVRIQHEGTQAASVPGLMGASAEATDAYSNDFECIRADVQYRPPRITPVPKINGIMTGVIESAGGDYAHLDEQGRYRVRMHFDKGEAPTAEASHWIRMKQPYSGPGYGIHFPNHEGTEMVWACVDGDPDRPMALGTTPNPSQVSPVTAENKWQSVIRTWGRNELTFDDKVGEENIYMFATKDHNRVVTNNETIHVGHDRAKEVVHDQAEQVGNNKSINVGVDHTETIGNNKSLNVIQNHDEVIGANMNIDVGQNLTEMVVLNYTEMVGVNMVLTVGVNLNETIGVNATEEVGNNKTVRVGVNLSETTGNNKTVDVGENLTETVGGDHHEEVTKEYAVNAKKIQLMAEDEIVLKTGNAELIMKKNGDIELQGKKISIKGTGDIIIKGKNIKEN